MAKIYSSKKKFILYRKKGGKKGKIEYTDAKLTHKIRRDEKYGIQSPASHKKLVSILVCCLHKEIRHFPIIILSTEGERKKGNGHLTVISASISNWFPRLHIEKY